VSLVVAVVVPVLGVVVVAVVVLVLGVVVVAVVVPVLGVALVLAIIAAVCMRQRSIVNWTDEEKKCPAKAVSRSVHET